MNQRGSSGDDPTDTPTRSRGMGRAPQEPGPTKPKRSGLKGCGCLGGAALLVVVIVAIAQSAGAGKPAASTAATTATQTNADSSYTNIPIYPMPTDPSPSVNPNVDIVALGTTAATVSEEVTYRCTGQAPDGVDITYGPEGSDYSASHLPFTKTVTLDPSAQYYVTEAQLSGSGQVTCTTTVQTSDGTKTVNTATAEGGYNIASAEVCGTFDGGWDKC